MKKEVLKNDHKKLAFVISFTLFGNTGASLKCGNVCILSTAMITYYMIIGEKSNKNVDFKISAHDSFLEYAHNKKKWIFN